MAKKEDIVTWIVVIGIIVYILLYLLTHSPQVTLGEVLTVWGGTLVIFSWLLDRTERSIKEYIDLRIDNLEKNLRSKRKE
jgi:drug/metabolite transporter superfamily protein YnfA